MSQLTAQQNRLKWLVIILFALAWAAMKLSLPALPKLITLFHTTPSKIKLSVTLFFGCYALSQLFWGGLSEKIGRRKTILIGLSLSAIGTLCVIFASGILSYIVGRSLEGIGIGVASPMSRAILVDAFDRLNMARILAICSGVTALMPALAPISGGFILVHWGWRYIFVVFFVALIAYLAVSFFKLPETHPSPAPINHLGTTFASYITIIKQPLFWGYIACYALIQGTLLGYYGAMPFWFVRQWHMQEQVYPFLAIFNVSAYIIALLLTRRLIGRYKLESLLRFGRWVSLGAGIFAGVLALLGITGIAALVATLSIFAFSSGMVFPTANALALSAFKSTAAMSAACASTSMFLMAAILSWIESHLSVATLWPLTVLLLLIGGITLSANKYLLRLAGRANAVDR